MPLPRFISRHLTKSSFFLIYDYSQDFVLAKWCENPFVYAIWSTICSVYMMALVVYSAMTSQYGIKILIWLTYWAFYSLALRFCITAFNSWFNILRQKREHLYALQAETMDTISRRHIDDKVTIIASYSDESSSDKCLENVGVDGQDKKCGVSVRSSININEQNEQCENNLSENTKGQNDPCEKNTSVTIIGQNEQCENNLSVTMNGQTRQCKNNLPAMIALQWYFQNISNSVSLLVTVLFWGLVYTGEPQDYSGINAHVINSLLVTGDILMSRAPIRIQHLHMPLTYLAIYISFTLVYWAGGGTNQKGQNFIYSVLDYSKRPAFAAMAICMIALLGVLFVQIYLYFLYRLRNALYTWKREGALFYA